MADRLPDALFDVLHRAMLAGGIGLALKQVAGLAGKAGLAIVEPLVQAGLLVCVRNKYSVSAEGVAQWEAQAPADLVRERQQRIAREREQEAIDLLRLVRQKAGKFTAADMKRWAGPLDELCSRGWIAPGAKANQFVVTALGEKTLLAALPPAEQIQAIRQIQAELRTRWSSLHDRWLAMVDATLHSGVMAISETSQGPIDRLHEAIEAASAFDVLAQTMAGVRAELDRVQSQAIEAQQQSRQSIDTMRHELARFDAEVRDRLGSVPVANVLSWEAARGTLNEMRLAASRLGGLVKVPELVDELRRHGPSMTNAEIHRQLLDWEQADRLTLQVCNDRHLEPRASEGIESPRGLLFYVRLN